MVSWKSISSSFSSRFSVLQMSSRLYRDEVWACRPPRCSCNQSQATDHCHDAGVVCDWVCSHHGVMYSLTVSYINILCCKQQINWKLDEIDATVSLLGLFFFQLLVETGLSQAQPRTSPCYRKARRVLLSIWEWYLTLLSYYKVHF